MLHPGTPFDCYSRNPREDDHRISDGMGAGAGWLESLFSCGRRRGELQLFIPGGHSIVIAGTHGKTTTASLMAWALERAGLNPSFLVGGVAENFNSSFRVA